MTTTSAARGKRIFITGGASGLGRALAERYALAGWRVAIGDVNAERLAETDAKLGEHALSFKCDVTRPDDLVAVARALEEQWGGVDVVVNNAGVASGGVFDEIPLEEWARVVDINLMGVVRGCHAFVPLMKRQKSGHIVNIASMAGLMNLPRMASYNTTKAAVIALSETLRMELAEHGIAVSVVCPSFFRTNLAESLSASASAEVVELTTQWVARNKISADTIAERVYRAVEDKELHVLTHGETKLAWTLKRLLPFGVFASIIAAGAARVVNSKRQQPVPAPPAPSTATPPAATPAPATATPAAPSSSSSSPTSARAA